MKHTFQFGQSKYSYESLTVSDEGDKIFETYHNCVIIESPQKSTIGTFIPKFIIIHEIKNNVIHINVYPQNNKYENVTVKNQ